MALRAIVTDITSIDEAVRDFYVEKDGKYVLDVEPAEGFKLENITGLTTALGTERHRRSELEASLKAFADLDPNAARDALARVTEFGDLDPAKAREAIATAERLSKFNPEQEADKIAEAKFNNSKSQLTTQFERRENELNQSLTSLKELAARREKQVEKLLKENTIKTELAKHKPLDEAADILERIVADNVRLREVEGQYINEVVDEKGVPRIKDYNGTPFTIADYVAELREKRPSLFQPDNTVGAGMSAKPSSSTASASKNPWMKGPSFSITQQMILLNREPQTAARLMAEAGVS